MRIRVTTHVTSTLLACLWPRAPISSRVSLADSPTPCLLVPLALPGSVLKVEMACDCCHTGSRLDSVHM